MATLRLEFIRGTLTGKIIDVTVAGAFFGRDADCEIRLDEALISRRHARIRFDDGAYALEDLGSTNGVRVNGIRLKGTIPLADGDHVRIGESEFICRLSAVVPVGERTTEGRRPDIGKTHIPDADFFPPPATVGPSRPLPRWLIPSLIILLILSVAAWLLYPTLMDSDGPDSPLTATGGGDAPGPDSAATDTHADDPAPYADVDLPPWPEIPPSTFAGDPPARDVDSGSPRGDSAEPAPPKPIETKDAHYIWVDSRPTGATVVMKGDIIGRTPLFIDSLTPALYALTFQHAGYETAIQTYEIPSFGRPETVTLRQSPNTCLVSSDPPGAAILHGSQVLGYTPAVVPRLPAGADPKVRLALPYFAPLDLPLAFDLLRPTSAEAVLTPQIGRLEVQIIPAGASVILDNFDKGIAAPIAAGVATARPITFSGLAAGQHQLLIEHLGVRSPVQTLTVEPDATCQASIVLWLPDTEITLTNGKSAVGLVLEETPTAITFLIEPEKSVSIDPATIKTRRTLESRVSVQHYQDLLAERRRQDMQRKLEDMRKDGEPF